MHNLKVACFVVACKALRSPPRDYKGKIICSHPVSTSDHMYLLFVCLFVCLFLYGNLQQFLVPANV